MNPALKEFFPYPVSESTIESILKGGSFLVYEFKDKKITDGEDSYGESYIKYISPLFVPEVINSGDSSVETDNQLVLDILTEETPFYHLQSAYEHKPNDKYYISRTRDLGINDVPTPLQTPFWEVWFRESMGDIQNNILLDIFNKLRYPFINENQYLSARLFPILAEQAYGNTGDKNSLIEFNYTEVANNEVASDPTRSKYEVGCVDYINDIVNQKLSSTYAMLDYNPDQSGLLTDWAESLYLSGRLDYAQMESEKTIFKLQDLKSELLRRKFAGSATLYNLTLTSIDRRGSFLGAVSAGRIQTVYTKFKDKRFMRLVNLPGLLTDKADLSDSKPLDVYYTKPLANKEKYIPLGTTTPLFYTSAPQSDSVIYDPEKFYLSNGSQSIEDYRNKFLRDNSSIITWNTPQNIQSSRTIRTSFPRLDETFKDKYRILDGPYIDPTGKEHEIICLDTETPVISSVTTSESVLDINADKLLYHRNSLQKELTDSYPFLTSGIAENNSVSLMDTSWISYLKNATERKSRIQDRVNFGTQISHYKKLNAVNEAEYNFFGISYNYYDSIDYLYEYNDGVFKMKATKEDPRDLKPRYAYLWFMTLVYDAVSFSIQRITRRLITKIHLRITDDESVGRYTHDEVAKLTEKFGSDSFFQQLTEDNIGIAPFIYDELDEDDLNSLKIGIYHNNNNYGLYDDITPRGYNKARFVFADTDTLDISDVAKHTNTKDDEYSGMEPRDVQLPFTLEPSDKTKCMFYVLERAYRSTDPRYKGMYRHLWSEPIRVIEVSSKILDSLVTDNKAHFYPDWYGLGYHLNPYLNFTEESASALRHKKVLPAYPVGNDLTTLKDSTFVGPSNVAGLSNQACTHHMDFNRNDTGHLDDLLNAEGKLNLATGFYLERTAPEPADVELPDTEYTSRNLEFVSVFGDNRQKDVYDVVVNVNDTIPRSRIFFDENKYPCIHFAHGNSKEKPIEVGRVKRAYNFYELNPFNLGQHLGINRKDILDENSRPKVFTPDDVVNLDGTLFPYNYSDIKHNWYWNRPSDGISGCMTLLFDKLGFYTFGGEQPKYINLVSRKPVTYVDDASIDSEFSFILKNNNNNNWKFALEYYPTGSSSVAFTVESDDYTEDSIANKGIHLGFSTYVHSESTSLAEYFNIVTMSIIVNNSIYTVDYKIAKNKDSKDFKDRYNVSIMKDNGEEIPEPNLSKMLNASMDKTGFNYREDAHYITMGKSFVPAYPPKFDAHPAQGRRKRIIKNNLEGIRLFCDARPNPESPEKEGYQGPWIQENMFNGNVYDLRLYNKGMDSYALKLISSGMVRESFSLAPAAYKIGYSLYRDLGAFKRFTMKEGKPQEVDTVRIFNRSLWDSILVDMYPVAKEEQTSDHPQYALDAVNPQDDTDIFDAEGESKIVSQQLLPIAEVINENNPLAGDDYQCHVAYNGDIINIEPSDYISLVTTSLYPVRYSNHDFESGVKLVGRNDPMELTSEATGELAGHPISIPAHAIGNTLEYTSDLDINFELYPETNLAEFYAKGTNIALTYSVALGAPCVRLSNVTTRDSFQNSILTSISIPMQEHITGGMPAYFDRLYFKDFQLDSSFSKFLRATSYYNEVRVPVLYRSESKNTLFSRWIGMRLLKEGTYYFTVKYPVQFMPLADYEYSTSTESHYATLYASARFKVEVKGQAIPYDRSFDIKGIPEDYLANNVRQTIESGASLSNASDNRTFPHRQMDIDLYFMDCQGIAGLMKHNPDESYTEEYKFQWKKLASNHDFREGIASLDGDTLLNPLSIHENVPFFFSKNFTSPFFIAKTEKNGGSSFYNPSSADDDLIDPIRIDVIFGKNNLEREKLNAETEEELNNLCMIAGKSYKMLFDYDACMPEISFTDKYYREEAFDKESNQTYTTGEVFISEDEKVNYTRLANINLNDSLLSDYLYTGDSDWYTARDGNINVKTSGFAVDSDGNWMMGTNYDGTRFFMGNPYSRASSKNYILKIDRSRNMYTVDHAFFPYAVENYPIGSSVPARYMTSLDAVDNRAGSNGVTTLQNFPEKLILVNLWKSLWEGVSKSIAEFQTSPSGLLSSLTKVIPWYHFELASGDHKMDYDLVDSDDFELYRYIASDRIIPSSNPNIYMTRRGTYSNNLILDQNFLSEHWTTSYHGSYVSDNTWDNGLGKDVYHFNWRASDFSGMTPVYKPLTMKYYTGGTPIQNTFEIAINVKCSEIANVKVRAVFLRHSLVKDVEVGTVDLEATSKSQRNVLGNGLENDTWYVFSGEGAPSDLCDSIQYEFIYTGEPHNAEYKVDLDITKPILRKSEKRMHYSGLANVAFNDGQPAQMSTGVTFTSHSMVIFKNRATGSVIPVTFKTDVKSRLTELASGEVESDYYPLAGGALQDFILKYSYNASTAKLERMFKPWIRQVKYWEQYKSDAESIIKDGKIVDAVVKNKVAFYKYQLQLNDVTGVKTLGAVKEPTSDIFLAENKPDPAGGIIYAFDYDDGASNIRVNSLKIVGSDSALGEFKTNMRIHLSDPVRFTDEKFSSLSNCFHPEKYKKDQNSIIAVTNIQLLGKKATKEAFDPILYEYEYLPIIYDEHDQHISLNLLVHTTNN